MNEYLDELYGLIEYHEEMAMGIWMVEGDVGIAMGKISETALSSSCA